MQALAWEVPTRQTELDLAPKADVRINDTAAVIAGAGDVAELTPMRWSFPPTRPGAGPLFNYRAEGRSFANANRCLIPASAFFEFTTPENPQQKRKDKWRFSRIDGNWFCIAGLWRPAVGNQPATFTMLTCDAGPDIAPIHKRQIVVLERPDWRTWLTLSRPEGKLLRPSPSQTFRVARAA